MPFAIVVVSPPACAYAWLIAAIGGLLYAAYVPRAVVGMSGAAAGGLATLGYLQAPPDPTGLVLLALGVLLLNLEFRVPAFGAAALLGLATTATGSWRVLAAVPPVPPLSPALRIALSAVGALALLLITERAVRRHTLPP
jgi:membrane-bound serine protease (ClpP class)